MAAPKENLLSLGHLTGTERNTFTKQSERCVKKSVNRSMLLQDDFSTLQCHQDLRRRHLQQRWQELKERERRAQHHNRQLLQQFEKAQDTLKEMLARNAAMKTIRVEFERYLEENSPRWQQQLREKTRTAQKKLHCQCEKRQRDDCLSSHLQKSEEERVTKSSAAQPLLPQGPTTRPQKISAPQQYSSQEYSDYNQEASFHIPYTQSSWLTHTRSQRDRFPMRVPFQPHMSSQVPPSFFPLPNFPHHASTPSQHHPWPGQDPPGWNTPQLDYPWSWAAGAAGILSGSEALWGHLHTEEPPPEPMVSQAVDEKDETSRPPSSKRERGGGSSSTHLSQELDIKPVRLSSSHAESSDSSLASRKKRKKREKRGRAQCTSSDRERHSSQELSRTSSAGVIASGAAAQSSESDASSEKHSNSRSTRRSGGLPAGSPGSEKAGKERTRSKGDDSESQHAGEELGSSSEESKSENVGNQSHDDKPESCGDLSGSQKEEESGSESVKIENGVSDEIEKQESSSSEQSSTEGKGEEERRENVGTGGGEHDEDKENIRKNEDEDRDDESDDDDDVSARKRTTEEEEEIGTEDEMEDQGDDEDDEAGQQSNRLKNEDTENRKLGSASSQDEEGGEDGSEGSEDKKEEDEEGGEDGSEGSEDKKEEDEEGSVEEEDGESEEEEEHRGEAAGEPEDRDSDDSIISPQEKRSKQMEVILEEAAEDVEEEEEEEEEESKAGSSNNDSNEFSDEDIEDLLAPQDPAKKKEEKELKVDEKPKAIGDNMKMFYVEPEKSKTNHRSDSDEFDDFYD